MNRFAVIETSDFNLLNRFLMGQDIRPILEQRATLGFNSCRVWTAYEIPLIGRLDPYDYPDYFERLPRFMRALEQYGLYAEITAFTGPYVFFPDDASKIEHWNRLDDALTGVRNLLDLELVNEWDNGPNLGLPFDQLRRPVGKIASHGSSTQDAPPKEPHWDVAGYRSPSNEWQRKVGHNAMEWADTWRIPVWTNEYPRTDNDPNLVHWYDGAASSVLLCAGAGCFHSPSGKNSTLFEGVELQCAESFIAGARSVPLEFQDGAYQRVEPPYPPDVIRIYRRVLPDGRFHEVQVHA